jgi:general secretion pathway protein J
MSFRDPVTPQTRMTRGAPPVAGARNPRRTFRSCHSARGFTLLELVVALLLLALMSSILYGSLSLSANSWDKGEAKAEQASDMRLTEEFLRQALSAQHPLLFHKVLEQPLYFVGASDSLSFAAALPSRAGGGMYYFRLALTPSGETSRLTLARLWPDYSATAIPEFGDAEKSVLAENVSEIHFAYFGRDPDSTDAAEPTWRNRWDDTHVLPTLIRMEVKPVKGPAWPPLIVEPRIAPEAGCRAWDANRNRCVAA